MMGKLHHLRTLLVGLALIGTACAPMPMAKASDELTPRAARIAQALAEAEAAHDSGENERLSQLVSALQASGATPHDDGQSDMVSQWSMTTGLEITPYRGRLLGPAYVRGVLAPGESW